MVQDLRPRERPGSELAMFTRKVLIVVAVALVVMLLWAAREVLLLVFIAAVLAAGISPVVRRVRILWRYQFRRKLSRGPAVMIVYLPFVVVVAFIVPHVMSRKVSISPLAIFVAFMIGASLLGVIGAILAVPAAAIVQVAFDEAFVQRRERRQDQERSGTLLRKAD